MGYFPVRYDSKVVNYNRKMFIRLATGVKYSTLVLSILIVFLVCSTNQNAIEIEIIFTWPGPDPMNIFSINLRYPHFRALLLVEILEQPIRMLINERSLILCWKYLFKTGPWARPYKHFQCKYYAMLVFKHSDWLLNFLNQSDCLKRA